MRAISYIFLGAVLTSFLGFYLLVALEKYQGADQGFIDGSAFLAVLSLPFLALFGALLGWLVYRMKSQKRPKE